MAEKISKKVDKKENINRKNKSKKTRFTQPETKKVIQKNVNISHRKLNRCLKICLSRNRIRKKFTTIKKIVEAHPHQNAHIKISPSSNDAIWGH